MTKKLSLAINKGTNGLYVTFEPPPMTEQAVCMQEHDRSDVIHPSSSQDVYTLQKFDKQPQYSEVNPGEDIKLDCKIFNKRGTCSWQKDNKAEIKSSTEFEQSQVQIRYTQLVIDWVCSFFQIIVGQ
ncbi:hypothetical protein J6590_051603 [Homalodisca vitripennis]|nr:hypothetical protein J6590_051603 [Homalodisca vitripennis]